MSWKLLPALFLLACPASDPDDGVPDGSTDAGSTDAGTSDAGSTDAGDGGDSMHEDWDGGGGDPCLEADRTPLSKVPEKERSEELTAAVAAYEAMARSWTVTLECTNSCGTHGAGLDIVGNVDGIAVIDKSSGCSKLAEGVLAFHSDAVAMGGYDISWDERVEVGLAQYGRQLWASQVYTDEFSGDELELMVLIEATSADAEDWFVRLQWLKYLTPTETTGCTCTVADWKPAD